jgi:type IV pilus assembly protein PilX
MIRPATPCRHQCGATLIVSMILLMVMSLLAIASLRSTIMQERMSANTYDHDMAFQAAEAGLRIGESKAEAWAAGDIPAPPPSIITCPTPNPGTGLYVNKDLTAACKPLWEESAPGQSGSFWHDASGDGGSVKFASEGLSLSPWYIVELISDKAPCNPNTPSADPNCLRFRITATSRDADGRAKVVLQSIYATGT